MDAYKCMFCGKKSTRLFFWVTGHVTGTGSVELPKHEILHDPDDLPPGNLKLEIRCTECGETVYFKNAEVL